MSQGERKLWCPIRGLTIANILAHDHDPDSFSDWCVFESCGFWNDDYERCGIACVGSSIGDQVDFAIKVGGTD